MELLDLKLLISYYLYDSLPTWFFVLWCQTISSEVLVESEETRIAGVSAKLERATESSSPTNGVFHGNYWTLDGVGGEYILK